MPDRIVRYARTDWRRILALFLIVGSTSAAIYFGVSARVEQRIIERRGTACVDLNRGRRVAPSPGCFRIAVLMDEVCRRRPLLRQCLAASLDSPAGRRLIRRTLAVERRRAAERRRDSARARARARRRRARAGGRGGSGGGSGRSPQTPGGGSTGTPGTSTTPSTNPSTNPSNPTGPPRPTPGDVVDEVLQDPVGALTDPVDTVNDTLCSVGAPCDGVPPVP